MAITNLASYAGMVTYGLAPVGLALELAGTFKAAVQGGGKSGQQEQQNPVNELAIQGKTIQQVAAMLLLIKTGLDYGLRGDYIVPSLAGVGTATIFAGGILKPKLKDFGMTDNHSKKFSTVVDLSVLSINMINILVLNGSDHLRMGTFAQQICAGSSMAMTTALSFAVCLGAK